MGRIRFRRFLVVKIIVIYYRKINDLCRGAAIFSNRFDDFFSCGYFACQSKNSEVGNIMPVIGSRRNTDAVHNAIGFREGLGRGVKYLRVDDFSLFVFYRCCPVFIFGSGRDHCDACTAFVVPGLHQIYKFAWKCDFAAVEDESRFPEFFRYVFIASMVRRFLGDSAWVFCFICASMPLKELKINNTSIKRIFMFIFLYLCSGSPNFYKVTCFYGSQCNI